MKIINKYNHSVSGWVGNHLNKTIKFAFEVAPISYDFDIDKNKFIFIMPFECLGGQENGNTGKFGTIEKKEIFIKIENSDFYKMEIVEQFKESYYSKLLAKFIDETPSIFKFV